MKHLFLFLLLGVTLAFSSCKNDPCADKMCGSYAFCEDGTCKCDPGYQININGLCVPTNPCANVVCGQDSTCVNGTCQPVIVDPCANVNCQNGTCVNGNCDCDPGYELDANGQCTVEWSADFVGVNLAAQDVCTPGSLNAGTFIYAADISATGPTTLSSSNLFGYGSSNTIPLTVTSATEVSVNYTDIGGRNFVGTGTKSGNTLTMDVVVSFSNNGGTDTCQTTITY